MDNLQNPDLRKAVMYLKGNGIIKRDKDVADKTGYGKANVSQYLSGKTKASKAFLDRFEHVFKVKLGEFEPGATIENPDALQLLSERVIRIEAGLSVNRQLLIDILSSMTGKTSTEIQTMASKAYDYHVSKLINELKQDNV